MLKTKSDCFDAGCLLCLAALLISIAIYSNTSSPAFFAVTRFEHIQGILPNIVVGASDPPQVFNAVVAPVEIDVVSDCAGTRAWLSRQLKHQGVAVVLFVVDRDFPVTVSL